MRGIPGAGYGALTITKSISIQGHGFAGISTPSGTAITVSANGGGFGDRINLRGLLIDGVGTGNIGIDYNAGASLNVQDCLIRNFTGPGISVVFPGAFALFASDTLIADNGLGVRFYGTANAGSITGMLKRIVVEGNAGTGVLALGTNTVLYVTIADSVVSNNVNGIEAYGQAYVMVRDTVIANHTAGTGLGLLADAATVRLSGSTITGNAQGLASGNGAVIYSYGNNKIDGNGSSETPDAIIPTK